MEDRLLTYEQAGALLCFGRRKIRDLVASGDIQAVPFGARRRIRASEVQRYIAELPAIDQCAEEVAS